MRSVVARERGHGHGGLADQAALGLPHRLEAQRLGPLDEAASPSRIGWASCRYRATGARQDRRRSTSADHSRCASSQARARISFAVDPGAATAPSTHDLAVDHHPLGPHARGVGQVPRVHRLGASTSPRRRAPRAPGRRRPAATTRRRRAWRSRRRPGGRRTPGANSSTMSAPMPSVPSTTRFRPRPAAGGRSRRRCSGSTGGCARSCPASGGSTWHAVGEQPVVGGVAARRRSTAPASVVRPRPRGCARRRPGRRPRPATASRVPSESVRQAWAPTMPRPPARRKRSFSARPAAAPSRPWRSVTS